MERSVLFRFLTTGALMACLLLFSPPLLFAQTTYEGALPVDYGGGGRVVPFAAASSWGGGFVAMGSNDVVGGFVRETTGLEADTYNIGSERIDIGILDLDANISSTTYQILTGVEVFSVLGDSETVDLIEVGPDVGYFRIFRVHVGGAPQNMAGLPTSDTVGGVYGDGVLFCGNGDTIYFTYTSLIDGDSITDTALMFTTPSTATVSFTDSGLSTRPPYFQTTDTAYVTVFDPDANIDPLVRDTVTVSILNLVTGDSVTLLLVEDNIASGFFASDSSLASDTDTQIRFTTTGPVTLGDTTISCAFAPAQPFNPLVLTYIDRVNSDAAQDTIYVVGAVNARGAFTNQSGGTTVAQYGTPGKAYVLIVDPDRNQNPAVRETIEIEVRSSLTGDTEKNTLLEIGPNFGIFLTSESTGDLLLSDTTGVNRGDGLLFCGVGDVITFAYQDIENIYDTASGSASIAQTPSTGAVYVTNSNYALDVLPETVVIGANLYVAVRAADYNDYVYAADSITFGCTITSPIGDTVIITLSESIDSSPVIVGSNTSAIFTNYLMPVILSDTTGLSDTHILLVRNNDVVTVTYLDRFTGVIHTDTVTAVRLPSRSVTQFVHAETDYANATDTIALRSAVGIRVIDPDRNANSSVLDTVTVTLINSLTGDTQLLTLTESDYFSGEFNNRLDTVVLSDTYGLGVSGAILASVGDTLLVAYNDPSDPTDSSAAVAAVGPYNSAGVCTLAVQPASPAAKADSYRIGDSYVWVHLYDPDQNQNSSARDTATVRLIVSATGDSVEIILIETTDTSGFFTNAHDTIALSDTMGLDPADTRLLLAGGGDTLLALFVDPISGDAVFDTAELSIEASTSTLKFVASDFSTDTDFVAIGSPLRLRVEDRGTNFDPLLPDTIYVTLQSFDFTDGRIDTVTVALVETSDTSRVFTNAGDLITASNTAALSTQDKILLVGAGDTVEAVYRGARFDTGLNVDSVVMATQLYDGQIWILDEGFATFPETRSIVAQAVSVRVADTGLNRDPLRKDTMTVLYVCPATKDSVVLTLTETGETSGIFDSRMDTGYTSDTTSWFASATNSILAVVGETIGVLYQDSTPALGYRWKQDAATIDRRYTPSTVVFADSKGNPVTQYFMNEFGVVVVEDADQNRNPLVREWVWVQITSSAGDAATIGARETSETSAVFSSLGYDTFTFSDTTGLADTAILMVNRSETIHVLYVDPPNANEQSWTEALIADGTLFFTRTGSSADAVDTYILGDSVYIRVLDAFSNLNPGSIDSLSITAQSFRNGALLDTAVVNLLETGVNDGVFTNAASPLYLSPQGGLGYADILLGSVGDTINIVHTIQGQPLSDTALVDTPITTANVVFRNSDDTATVGSYQVTNGVVMRVIDLSRALDPLARDQFDVILTCPGTADRKTVTLLETADSSAVFANTIPIVISDTAAGTYAILAGGGQKLVMTYQDSTSLPEVPAESQSIMAGVTAYPFPDSIAFMNSAYSAPVSTVYIGDYLFIQLVERGIDENPAAIDTVTVRITTSYTGDVDDVVLTENAPAGGDYRSFSGQILLTDTGGLGQTNIIFAGPTDILAVQFTGNGNPWATAAVARRTTPGTSTFIDSGFNPATVYVVGENAAVEVQDPDRNTDVLSQQSFNLAVYVEGTGDYENITLTETANSSPVFRSNTLSVVAMTAPAPTPNDGRLETVNNDVVYVVYVDTDAGTADTAVANISQPNIPATLWPVGFDTASAPWTFRIGDTLSAVVLDGNQDGNGSIAETVPITFIAGGRDTVTAVLTESGTSTAYFYRVEGVTTRLRETGYSTADSILDIAAGESVVIHYEDPTFSTDSALAEALSVLGFTPAAGSFATNALMDTDQFLIGESVYVRVTDPDRNRDGTRPDSFLVMLWSGDAGDSESLLLWETGDATGIFFSTGGAMTVLFNGFIQAGKLNVNDGDSIYFRYIDAFDSSDSVVGIANTYESSSGGGTESITYVISTTPGGSPVEAVVPGDVIYIRNLAVLPQPGIGLIFSDLRVDSFVMRVESTATGDWVESLFTEDTPAANTFNNTNDPITTALYNGFNPPSQRGGDSVLEILPYDASVGDLLSAAAQGQGGIVFSVGGGVLFVINVQAAASVDLNQLIVYPNPFKPTDGNAQTGSNFVSSDPRTGILFAPMPSDFRLRIYTLDGRLVLDKRGQTAQNEGTYYPGAFVFQWDGRNDGGHPVASGIYVWHVESAIGQRSGKLAIIR